MWFASIIRLWGTQPVVRQTVEHRLTMWGFETLEIRVMLSSDPASRQLLVQFVPQASETDRNELLSRVHGQAVETVETASMLASGDTGFQVVQFASTRVLRKVLRTLNANPLVKFAESNGELSDQAVASQPTVNDPYFADGTLWGMGSPNSSPVSLYGSRASDAWQMGATGSSSVLVGVVDEGIDFSHPDLAPNMWTNPYDPADGIDNDGNGYIDDIHGWDFAHQDNTVYDKRDGDEHGTHVAGTLGAVGDNGIGVAGVAWQVGIISAKFISKSGGSSSNAVKAIDYLTDLKTRHGLNIVASNNSWVGGKFSQAMQDAIDRAAAANILFVAAAGNGSPSGTGYNNDVRKNYPSNYSSSKSGYDNVIAVAAIARQGKLASFSNYGLTTVDLAAPGVAIMSTIPGGKYDSYTGTSMATPHVTGAIALYAAAHPGATAAGIKSAILDAARDTPEPSLAGKTVTGGRLNVSLLGTSLAALKIGNAQLPEGDGNTVEVTVTLTRPSDVPITVHFETQDGTARAGDDYVPIAGTLTFEPGVTSQTLTLDVVNDTLIEGDETIQLTFADAQNAVVANRKATVTILDDELPPTVSINEVSQNEGRTGETEFVFTVSLSAPSQQKIYVNFAIVGDTAKTASDFVAYSGRVVFDPGVTSKPLTVRVKANTIREPDEKFFVQLSNPVNARSGTMRGIGTILNDD